MDDVQFVERVAERDIDLLLLEELHVSAAFRAWLLNQVFGSKEDYTQFVGAWHSVIHPTLGESDLLLLVADNHGGKAALLIENKIDAVPQLEQGPRYQLRGTAGLADGLWSDFRTCIVAPEAYLALTSDADAYQAQLCYESIRDWFLVSGAPDDRSKYKARLVQEAIDQNRRGYRPITDTAVTQFWTDYWRFACTEFPQLQMKQPGKIPAESDWPQFRNPELGPGRRIVHKLADGVVDLEIGAAGDLVAQIVARNGNVLTGEAVVVRTGKSASIRLKVAPVKRSSDFSSQESAVRAGLTAASTLLALSSRIETG